MLEEMEATAEELAARAREGCLASFEILVRRHEKAVYNYLLQFTVAEHDAQDAAQEAFVRAWRGLDRFDGKRSFAAWLFGIARHVAADQRRRARRHEPLDPGSEFEAPAAEPAAPEIWTLARALKPAQFEVLWLHYGEGFAIKETARIMGITAIHAKVLLHRARAALKKKLESRQHEFKP